MSTVLADSEMEIRDRGTIERHDIPGIKRACAGSYSIEDRLRRVLWGLVRPLLFRPSPRHLYGWRNLLLRTFGARIGRDVQVYPSAWIFAPWLLVVEDEVTLSWESKIYNLAPVTIGARSIVSQYAHLCSGTHDYRKAHMPFASKPIVVESDCWICAEAFIGPGVTVGRLTVVGARAVVMRNVSSRAIVAGNPARQVGTR